MNGIARRSVTSKPCHTNATTIRLDPRTRAALHKFGVVSVGPGPDTSENGAALSSREHQVQGCPEAPVTGVSGHHMCALGGIRTPNLLIRSQMLYPLSYERRWAYRPQRV